MTKKQVIELYPVAESASLWSDPYFLFAMISLFAAVLTLVIIIVCKDLWSKRLVAGLYIFMAASAVSFVFGLDLFSNNLNEQNKALAQEREDWRENIYKPYSENVDQIKVKIFQSRWNVDGDLDLILDTDIDVKKTHTGIRSFSFYDTSDTKDKGYVMLKDFGKRVELPDGLDLLPLRIRFSSQYELAEVFLPRKYIKSSQN